MTKEVKKKKLFSFILNSRRGRRPWVKNGRFSESEFQFERRMENE